MPPKLFPTSLVGSYPQPDWLIDRARLSKMVPRVRMDDLWLVDPKELEAKQDEATFLPSAIRSAPGSTSLRMANNGAKAIPTVSPPRLKASIRKIPARP